MSVGFIPARIFLSPPSARRATSRRCRCCRSRPISIPALREEGDVIWFAAIIGRRIFLSPPSARRATGRHDHQGDRMEISIPALREEGDSVVSERLTPVSYFYPRPPRGGRLTANCSTLLTSSFLSPPSARRATALRYRLPKRPKNFYPRPPRGGRLSSRPLMIPNNKFLSPPSARRATGELLHSAGRHVISIPALREEGDCRSSSLSLWMM